MDALNSIIEKCGTVLNKKCRLHSYQTKGKEAARKSLQRLQTNDDVIEVYLDLIQEEIKAMGASKGTLTTQELFQSKKLRKQLIVGLAVQLMIQFSGIDAVFYYSTTIFYEAEVDDPELATTLLGIINVVVTIVAVKYMDSAGRKKLLTISWIGLLFSYLVLLMSFVLKPYFGFMDQVRCSVFNRRIKLAARMC